MANQRHHIVRGDRAGGAGLGGVAAVALDHRNLLEGLPTVQGAKSFRHRSACGWNIWQKSLRFFAEAPVLGHGTGSTRGLFEQAAVGRVGAGADVVANPHNQTLNVAVQWGVLGIVVLYAMWLLASAAVSR